MSTGEIREEDKVKSIHLLTHPIRYKIVSALRRSPGSMFIAQMAEAIDVNPRLVSFHLGVLLEKGYVEGDWQVSLLPRSKGKAVKNYKLTQKAIEDLSNCNL